MSAKLLISWSRIQHIRAISDSLSRVETIVGQVVHYFEVQNRRVPGLPAPGACARAGDLAVIILVAEKFTGVNDRFPLCFCTQGAVPKW